MLDELKIVEAVTYPINSSPVVIHCVHPKRTAARCDKQLMIQYKVFKLVSSSHSFPIICLSRCQILVAFSAYFI